MVGRCRPICRALPPGAQVNVLCYMQPQRGGGVARHALEMVSGLARQPDFQCALFASGPDLRHHASFRGQFPGLPVQSHPLPGIWVERAWKTIGWPTLERRCRGFDVIYSPVEVRLPGCRIPSIVTIHDVQALETDLPWSRSASHLAFRKKWLRWLPCLLDEATRIATVSEFSRQRLIALLNADPNRVTVVGNGVSSVFFRSPDVGDDLPPKPAVIVIGGLRMKKGAEHTLAVAAELQRRRSELVINVYGQHDPDWVPRAAAHPNVRLHGYADDDELARRLGESTALLFLSPYEGFGIPAIEAMASGAPAVVSGCASLPEVVGDAGIIVDAASPTTVADTLERLRADLVFRRRKVAAGRQRAERFTWASCVSRLAALVGEVAGRITSQPPPPQHA
jgi:glycosyltransferase involved in cell wall biosynthesis